MIDRGYLPFLESKLRVMMALILLLLGLLSSTAGLSSAAYPPLHLPTFALSDLQAPGTATLQNVGNAIASLGMFGVTGFHVDDVAHQALSKFVSCARDPDVYLRQVEMEDGSVRRTLAMATNDGIPQPLPVDTLQRCPDFATAATDLRAAVAAAGHAYAGILDKLLYGSSACATPDQCFTAAVRNAESLEHFHFFDRAPSPSAEHMLAMHSDIGLFLVMSPAELFNRADAATAAAAAGGDEGKAAAAHRAQDLVVQLADGSVVTPVLPAGALLVMNGEGLTRWMRMPMSQQLQPYSPLHEVVSFPGGGVRAWFGRMFMPPGSARLQVEDASSSKDDSANLTFAGYRQHTYTLFHDGQGHEASAAGCSPTRRLLADEGSCGANEVYCWHSCMKIAPNVTCGKEDMICANINNGLLWPQNYTAPGSDKPGHCKDCTIMCPASGAPPSASSFCNTNLGATTMWMTGFQFARGNENDPCVVFLFPEWVLDSAGKFTGACIGTFFMGVLIGAVGWVRNRLKDAWVHEGLWEPEYRMQWKVWSADAVLITIIAVQVCLGYWLMLVAMTYQAELFIMVVLGLACGHVFYRPRPTAAAAFSKAASRDDAYKLEEPCCGGHQQA